MRREYIIIKKDSHFAGRSVSADLRENRVLILSGLQRLLNVWRKGRAVEIMNETLDSILKAEKKAEQIVGEASERSKAVILRGEEAAERKKEEAVSAFYEERKKAIEEAEGEAEKIYGDMMDNGESEAYALKVSCKDKIEKAANDVIGRIFG